MEVISLKYYYFITLAGCPSKKQFSIKLSWDCRLDYLVGKTDILIDGKILNRIVEIQKLNADEQKTVFSLLDAYLRDTKTRKAYAA